MVDCSHGNSSKDHNRQPLVAADLGNQIAAGNRSIVGVMIESHLVGGRQNNSAGCELTYGQSITDACLGWDDTIPVLEGLASAVRKRRTARPHQFMPPRMTALGRRLREECESDKFLDGSFRRIRVTVGGGRAAPAWVCGSTVCLAKCIPVCRAV